MAVTGTVYGDAAAELVDHGPNKAGACSKIPAGQLRITFVPERAATKFNGAA